MVTSIRRFWTLEREQMGGGVPLNPQVQSQVPPYYTAQFSSEHLSLSEIIMLAFYYSPLKFPWWWWGEALFVEQNLPVSLTFPVTIDTKRHPSASICSFLSEVSPSMLAVT